MFLGMHRSNLTIEAAGGQLLAGARFFALALATLCAAGCVQKADEPVKTTAPMQHGGPAGAHSSTGATPEATTGEMAAGGAAGEMGGGATMSAGSVDLTTLSGSIKIEGSSTVYPVSQAMSVEFNALTGDKLDFTVGAQGTGSGFKSFIAGQCDLWDASRTITDDEKKQCAEKGLEYVEFQVCVDGLTVVVHPENTWASCLSVEQLAQLWGPDSKVAKWNELDPSFPDEAIKLYGPDNQSGTFDYFNEVVNGKAKASRTDYSPSTNDNILVQGVSGDKYALGYFGYAYYVENQGKLKAVAIKAKGSEDCVLPSQETIENGTYKPLSRPLFVYASKAALARPEITEFLKYYLSEAGQKIVVDRGYLPLNAAAAQDMNARLNASLVK